MFSKEHGNDRGGWSKLRPSNRHRQFRSWNIHVPAEGGPKAAEEQKGAPNNCSIENKPGDEPPVQE